MLKKKKSLKPALGWWGEQCWGPTSSNLLLQPGCWCPAKADAAAEGLEEIPRKKVKAFCLSSAGAGGVRVQNNTWRTQSGWVSSWGFVLIRAMVCKSWQQPARVKSTDALCLSGCARCCMCIWGQIWSYKLNYRRRFRAWCKLTGSGACCGPDPVDALL